MDDEFIKFKGVKKRFGKNLVLEKINLDIPEKKITGIIGASGEGKTTILKLLIGFYKTNEGEILLSKRKISKDMKNIEKTFGFATEDGSFHKKLTVMENFVHFGHLYNMRKKDILKKAKELCKLVGLEDAEKTLAENLSMGMKKRLDVAISLIHNPKILIMDEPTTDLDPLLRRSMLKLIKKINSKGTTIILTTQILNEMDEICDKIAILYEKKIVDQGSPQKIKSKYSSSNLNEVFNKIFSKNKSVKNSLGKKKKKEKSEEKKEEKLDSDDLLKEFKK